MPRRTDHRRVQGPLFRNAHGSFDVLTLVDARRCNTRGPGSRLRPGARFRFVGARPGGERFEWAADVLEIEEPSRIELAYAGGEYGGRTAWELQEIRAGTLVAYAYRGVSANSPRSRDHFARWGTRLHTVAMKEDALAGRARLLEGSVTEVDEEAWRKDVQRRVAAGFACSKLGPRVETRRDRDRRRLGWL